MIQTLCDVCSKILTKSNNAKSDGLERVFAREFDYQTAGCYDARLLLEVLCYHDGNRMDLCPDCLNQILIKAAQCK